VSRARNDARHRPPLVRRTTSRCFAICVMTRSFTTVLRVARAWLASRSKVFRCIAAVLLVASATRYFGIVRPFVVRSGSMEPTTAVGDQVLVERLTLLSRLPRKGDVVVFSAAELAPSFPGAEFVKRVVAVPGDRVAVLEGLVFVNGQDAYAWKLNGRPADSGPRAAALANDDLLVPAGGYFVLGDNAADSEDSRTWGYVPAKNIIGIARLRYWPLQKFGLLR
jgi:signal peptidase I